MKKTLLIIVLIALSITCGCKNTEFNGAHVVLGDMNGDIEIISSYGASLVSTELTLKDGSTIEIENHSFILFKDVCPICGGKVTE